MIPIRRNLCAVRKPFLTHEFSVLIPLRPLAVFQTRFVLAFERLRAVLPPFSIVPVIDELPASIPHLNTLLRSLDLRPLARRLPALGARFRNGRHTTGGKQKCPGQSRGDESHELIVDDKGLG